MISAITIANQRAKIRQREPLVSSALRRMLCTGPRPSTTQAGTTTKNIETTIAAGTIIKAKPRMARPTTAMVAPRAGKNRRSATRKALVHIDRPAAHVVDHDINHRGAGENVKHNVQGLRDAHSEGDVRSGRIVVRERHRDIEQQAGNEVEQQEWRRVAPQ